MGQSSAPMSSAMGGVAPTRARLQAAATLVGLLAVAGCGDDRGSMPPLDAGTDAGESPFDAGASEDGGPGDAGADAALPDPDAGPSGDSVPTGGSGGAPGRVAGTCAGGRNYLLHVPAAVRDHVPAPLVVGLHGAGDTHHNYFTVLTTIGWRDAAERNGFIFFVPRSLNPTRPSFLHISAGGTLDVAGTRGEVESVLACIYDGVGASYNVETTRIYLTGFSEGGHVADLAGLWLGDAVRAAAVYAGGVPGKASLGTAPRNIPFYFIVGERDGFLDSARAAAAGWEAAGHPVERAFIAGIGHDLIGLERTGPGFPAVYRWMSTVVADPVRSRVGR